MAADVDTDVNLKRSFAARAVDAGATALQIVQSVRSKAAGDRREAEVAKWLSDADIEDNLNYIIAVGHAIAAKTGSAGEEEQASAALARVGQTFRERYRPAENPVFRSLLF